MAFILFLALTTVLTATTASVDYQVPQTDAPLPDFSKDYDLLDLVLAASVDGKFHAFNRTSGRVLWSMSSFATTTSVSAPSALSPLVRTAHAKFDSDLTGYDSDRNGQNHETYIIEPQSGDIYVLHSITLPLQRFPFSMSELVEMSPFTSTSEEGAQVFVGKKERSLLLIELETGMVKATLNLSLECPIVSDDDNDDLEEHLIEWDALDKMKPLTSVPTEIYIIRTDYYISIHKKPRHGHSNPPVQKLSFSTYGANDGDTTLQHMYRRTRDDTYIQPLPNGEVVAFRTSSLCLQSKHEGGSVTGAIWGRPFSSPIVAVFDVLQKVPVASHHHHRTQHPFALLQPRPSLQDLFPSIDYNAMYKGRPLPSQGAAYVGIVEETGSLFVLSQDKYPLVVFGGHRGDPLEEGKDGESVDACVPMPRHARCFVGVHVLEDNDVEGRTKW